MKPRYFTHVKKFEGSTLYVKVCDEGTFSISTKGTIHLFGYNREDVLRFEMYVREGVWREIPIEEAVLL